MSRVIANALVLFQDERPSPNLWGQIPLPPSEIYLRNSYCSLCSARVANPDVKLVLIYQGNIPESYRRLFQDLGVDLVSLPFERYLVPETFPWRAGYYKLDAMEYLTEHFEQVLLLDTDTIVVGDLDDLWQEASN